MHWAIRTIAVANFFQAVLIANDAPLLRTFERHHLDKAFFSEGAAVGDFNRDGHRDVAVGPQWYAGPDFKERHSFAPPKPFDPHGYSDNFFAFGHDINGDGWDDILVLGFPGQDASWYENPQGKAGMWARNKVFDVVDNESPTWGDLTGDGKPEIICSTDGYFGYAAPNWSDPAAPWTFHRISDQSAGGRFTHGLGYGDVNGDGRMDLLEKSGWWEQPASLDGDPVWTKHAFSFTPAGGAQMYAYDVDGDGRNDVITSLQAHGYGLVWYRNVPSDEGVSFERQVITGEKPADNPYGVQFSQIHAIALVDMNGDGLKDIVSGKRYWAHGPNGDPDPGAPAVLYWFELRRGPDGVDWVPHLIDDDSGVGTQVVAEDVSGDGVPDVIVGNKKGAFVHLQKLKEVSREEFERRQPKKRPPMAEGLSPEAAAQAMTVPPGFHVRLCAAEPDVQQPIAMAFDDRGRLWVAEAYSYPVRVPDDQARDRILIFEDTDGDSKFDKRTVFIEGLNLVSGLEYGFGGIWVGAAPYLMFIPDRDGDDRPDGPAEILLDGWGYQDTHETLNAFIWGPDGWLYGCHGVFTHSRVGKPGTPDAERVPINAGIWRYHPVRREFEVFAEGTSNPWGVDFNEVGEAFATACVIPHLYHIIPGARYQRQAGAHFNPYTFDDIKTIARHRHWVGNQWNNADRDASNGIGGGHAHAGAMIYQGGLWPDRYRDQLFMNNIHGSRLNQDRLTSGGSGYVGDAAPDFCFANDSWSQWIYLTYGPDGNVTMIDWYDRNQCHHREDEKHDRGNGRIFKIIYGEPRHVEVDLAQLDDLALVEHLTNSNEWYSRHARRLLHERSASGKLSEQIREELRNRFQAAQSTRDQLRYLWALHITGSLTENEIEQAARAAMAPETIAWLIRLNAEKPTDSARFLSELAKLAETANSPVVRLAVCSALQRMPLDARWAVFPKLLKHAEDANDHNLPLMNWYAIEPCVMRDPGRALGLLADCQIPLVSRFIVRRLAAEESGYGPLLARMTDAPAADHGWMLEEVVTALKQRSSLPMPEAWKRCYEVLNQSPDATIRQQAEFVAVKFGDERVLPTLRRTLADRALPVERRRLALDSLLAARDSGTPEILIALFDDQSLSTASVQALASFDSRRSDKALLDAYGKLGAEGRQAAISTLLARVPSTLLLLDAIEAGAVPRGDLSAFAVRQLSQSRDERLLKRLNEVWGTIRPASEEKVAQFKHWQAVLTPARLKDANLPNGRVQFNKTCATCHKLFDAGKVIGPDLTGSNRHNLDYLMENLLDPSAIVGKDYQMTTFALADGRVISGVMKSENDTAVVVQTPLEVVTLLKDDIDERKLTDVSLMPEGQLKQLPEGDARDLVAYLQAAYQVPLPGEGPWLDPQTGRVAGAIEAESLKPIEVTGGAARPQPMAGFNLGRWSGTSQLWWTGGKPGNRLTLAIQVPEDGTYDTYTALTKAIDYGIVKISWDDEVAVPAIDLINDGVVITPPVSLGRRRLTRGEHRVAFEIVGANPAAVKGYMVGIDYVSLVPVAE